MNYRNTVLNISSAMSFTIEQVSDISADLLTKTMPLIAPLPSAVAIYNSLILHLGYSAWVAVPTAAAIEGLGFATADLTIKAWSYNQRSDVKSGERPSAPFGLSVFMFVSYMAAALGLILVLEVWPESSRYAPSGFPILTLLGALNLACAMLLKKRMGELESDGEIEELKSAIEKLQSSLELSESKAMQLRETSQGLTMRNEQLQSRIDAMQVQRHAVSNPQPAPLPSMDMDEVSDAQIAILRVIAQNPQMQQKDIASHVGANASTVSRQLKPLKDGELVEFDGTSWNLHPQLTAQLNGKLSGI